MYYAQFLATLMFVVFVAHTHWSAVLDQVHDIVHFQKVQHQQGNVCLVLLGEPLALEDVSRRGRIRRTVHSHFKVLASFGKFHCFDMATSLESGLEEFDRVL
ncbi:UNVERIFIED_CONTAM: hypothetical protein NCL1_50827 [Trichonephila clavipes]